MPEQYYYLATLLDEEMSEKEISLLFETHLTVSDREKWLFLKSYFSGKEEYPATPFLHAFFQKEREVREGLAFLRAKKWGRSLEGEKPVAKLQDLYEGNWNNPLGLHRAVLEYRKKQAKELVGLQVFTLDKLLAVYVQAALKEEE